jgi:hypothetical protein
LRIFITRFVSSIFKIVGFSSNAGEFQFRWLCIRWEITFEHIILHIQYSPLSITVELGWEYEPKALDLYWKFVLGNCSILEKHGEGVSFVYMFSAHIEIVV